MLDHFGIDDLEAVPREKVGPTRWPVALHWSGQAGDVAEERFACTILSHRPDFAELVAHVRADLLNDGERCPDAEDL